MIFSEGLNPALFTNIQVVSVSVVIPTLNAEENLPHVLPRIPQWVSEIIIVDGHSTDQTVAVARALKPDVQILIQTGRGKGDALRAGCDAASGDIVVMLDADGSTDPAEIPAFVGALISGADFVKGSRFLQGAGTNDMPFHRRLGNNALVFLANFLFGTSFTDITYGFNAMWKDLHPDVSPEIDGWAYEIVRNIRASRVGLRVVEVASFEHERIGGNAKLQTFSAGRTILKAILCERFTSCQRRNNGRFAQLAKYVDGTESKSRTWSTLGVNEYVISQQRDLALNSAADIQ